MRSTAVILVTVLLISCGTYKGTELWRRSTCQQIVDADEREQCLERATQSENAYKQDVEAAKGDPTK